MKELILSIGGIPDAIMQRMPIFVLWAILTVIVIVIALFAPKARKRRKLLLGISIPGLIIFGIGIAFKCEPLLYSGAGLITIAMILA